MYFNIRIINSMKATTMIWCLENAAVFLFKDLLQLAFISNVSA